MPNSSLTIQVPGKLMIAGEFAVLEAYQKLAVMAVDRFVYVEITSSAENYITLEKFQLENLKWKFDKKQVSIVSDDHRVNFVQEAMTIACIFLQEKGIQLENFSMKIKSDLDDRVSGKKYGLGSSAAVVVGVITAILQQHLQVKPEPILVFQLAAISHVKAQGNGSGADVAASAYGGILQYSSFQADWLRERYHRTNSLLELLDEDWKYFSVKPIQLPEEIHLCIGWTSSPASTGNLVEEILKLKSRNPVEYQDFLQSSEEAVGNFLAGIEGGDLALILKGIKQNRSALVKVGREAQTELETPIIKKLCDIAEAFGGAAKQSGAGGGDCGIAFMPSANSAKELINAWKKEGIIPLDLRPYPYGAKNLV